MCRHCIPHTTWLKFGHPHLKLAGWKNLLYNHAVYHTVVRTFQATQFEDIRFGFGNLLVGIRTMRRSRIKVKVRRIGTVLAAESYVSVAFSQIQSLFIIKFERLSVYLYKTRTSYIDNTKLTAPQKEGSA